MDLPLSSGLVDMRVEGLVDGTAALIHHVCLVAQSGHYFLHFFSGGAADVAIAWAARAGEDESVAFGCQMANFTVGEIQGCGDVFCSRPLRTLVIKKTSQARDVIGGWLFGFEVHFELSIHVFLLRRAVTV